jgi:hypothetical protein
MAMLTHLGETSAQHLGGPGVSKALHSRICTFSTTNHTTTEEGEEV